VQLRSILGGHDVRRVLQLIEGGGDPNEGMPQVEMDLEDFYPSHKGLEQYWTSEAMDWIIYSSHEHSITIGGDWLVSGIQREWPGWRTGLYTHWGELTPLPD
jgi:hypothetical protein